MNNSNKHHLLIGLCLCISLSVFHSAEAADKANAQSSKQKPAKVAPAKTKPVEIKTYTIIGHADTTPETEVNPSVSVKPLTPQFAARRFGPGQVGPGGRPWNPVLGFGSGPGFNRRSTLPEPH